MCSGCIGCSMRATEGASARQAPTMSARPVRADHIPVRRVIADPQRSDVRWGRRRGRCADGWRDRGGWRTREGRSVRPGPAAAVAGFPALAPPAGRRRLAHLGHRERLREVGVAARSEDARQVIGVGECGDGQQRRVADALVAAHRASDLQAVHRRHLHVQHDHVEARAVGKQCFESSVAVHHLGDAVAGVPQDVCDEVTSGVLVFDDQDFVVGGVVHDGDSSSRSDVRKRTRQPHEEKLGK